MTINEPTKPEICGAIIHVGFEGATTCGEPKNACIAHNAEARAKFLGGAGCNTCYKPIAECNCKRSQSLQSNVPNCCDKCKTYQGQVPICANAACSCHIMLTGNSNPFALGHSTNMQTLNTRDAPIEPSKEKVKPDAMCKCGHKLTWHIHKDIPESNCLNIDDPSCECLSFQKVESEWIGERRFMCHNENCKGRNSYFYGYEKMRDCPWCGGKDVTWRPVEVHPAPPFATQIAAARAENRPCEHMTAKEARAAAIDEILTLIKTLKQSKITVTQDARGLDAD